MGNTWSVISALNYLGVKSELSYNKEKIINSDILILPGVGSFKKGVFNLKNLGLFELIRKEVIENKKIIFGICLGFQLLGISSNEGGFEKGLNLISAEVEKFENQKNKLKIPHIGFNSVSFSKEDNLFLNLNEDSDFYFVHSYRFKFKTMDGFVSKANYGEPFIAAYHKNNIYGTQFHPEKSQSNGLMLLKNFFEFL